MSASQQIVVGVDGSPSSIQALDKAIATARNALTGPGEAEAEIASYVGEGPAAQVLLGSVSQRLVHHAHCPVVVIRDGAA